MINQIKYMFHQILSSTLLKRIKSLLWAAFGMGLSVFLAALEGGITTMIEDFKSLSGDVPLGVVILGLVISQITKYINNRNRTATPIS